MELITRRHGSQRATKPIELEFWPNTSGQGGADHLVFKGNNDRWYMITFDNMDEVIELLSQAHIVHHNFTETVRINQVKKAMGVL